MSDINDGGPAFPVLDTSQNLATGETTVHQACYSGMTLRDYFAAKAMQGLLSDGSAINEDTGKKLSIPDDAALIAVVAYDIADAMLEARKEQK